MYESVFRTIIPSTGDAVTPSNPIMKWSFLQELLGLRGPLPQWVLSRKKALNVSTPSFFRRGEPATPDEVKAVFGAFPSAFLSIYDALRVLRGSRCESGQRTRFEHMLVDAVADYHARGIKTGAEVAIEIGAEKKPKGFDYDDTRTPGAIAQARYRAKRREQGWAHLTLLVPAELIPEVRAYVKSMMRDYRELDSMGVTARRAKNKTQAAILREYAQAVDIDSFLSDDDEL